MRTFSAHPPVPGANASEQTTAGTLAVNKETTHEYMSIPPGRYRVNPTCDSCAPKDNASSPLQLSGSGVYTIFIQDTAPPPLPHKNHSKDLPPTTTTAPSGGTRDVPVAATSSQQQAHDQQPPQHRRRLLPSNTDAKPRALLKSLHLTASEGNFTIAPAFSPSVFIYKVSVPKTLDIITININASAADKTATVVVGESPGFPGLPGIGFATVRVYV